MPINIFTTFDDPSATRAQPLRVPARSERIHRGLFVAATLRDAGSHPHRVLADVEDDRDRLALAADLVRRRVAVIAASANAPALAAKAATATGTGTTSSTMPSTPASAEVALGPIPNLPKAVRAACRAV
jgi:hypothetical protein